MLDAEEIERMSTTERLQSMELLWASLSRSENEISSPEWHADVLAARQAKVDAGEAHFLSLDELKKRLRGGNS